MRIKSLELAWFRGAASPVSLEPNCKSMVVYGANGSGKSCFVDAVEYVLNNRRIEHLRNEYSGSRQENAIPNTHKPKGSQPSLRFKFKDDSVLQVDFRSNGSSKSSGAQQIAMHEWDYRQTVLRQNEVSDFIRARKGDKYSALLPLFGLHNLEIAADNLRQLAKSIEPEAGLNEKRFKLDQVESQRKDIFGTQSHYQIVGVINDLFAEYIKGDSTEHDVMSRCALLQQAITNRIRGYSTDNQKQFFLLEVTKSKLKAQVGAVRASSVDLAGSLDSQIAEKLEVLRATRAFVESLENTKEVKCPACGQTISADELRDHVRVESERLQDINKIFTKYKAAIGTVCDALNSLKSNLDRPVLKAWRNGLDDVAVADGFKFLQEANFNALRQACSDDDLRAIESKLLPIINAARLESKTAPPDVQELTDNKKLLDVAESVIVAEVLKTEVTRGDALVALLNSLERGVRLEIRRRSQSVIDNISKDIEAMWSILHPVEKIDSVRLSLPQSADKAIDVMLKFHGLEQDSPSLTLSEGYRNSLGLCIFLAMAKQVGDIERPLFLDDVVVSLDRNHRGMIQKLLEKEFSDRQVVILTHDREWYTELRNLLPQNRWIFKTLLPYETPDIGIRWSHKTTTFDDARALIAGRPDAAGNDARKIMDVELPIIAERLRIRLPYLRSDKNDMRMANDFLTRLVADGKKCFEKKSGNNYVKNSDAVDACSKAHKRLKAWGNRASHTFDLVRPEAIELIEACEIAIASFKCESCNRNVWRLENSQSKFVQCQCSKIRWRYDKA